MNVTVGLVLAIVALLLAVLMIVGVLPISAVVVGGLFGLLAVARIVP